MYADTNTVPRADGRAVPWNKGKLLGQKPPLKLKEIWASRIRLQMDHRTRELALFNLAIDSKLRGWISSGFASTTWFWAAMSPPEPMSCNRRLSDRCSLTSLSKHGTRSQTGSRWRT